MQETIGFKFVKLEDLKTQDTTLRKKLNNMLNNR